MHTSRRIVSATDAREMSSLYCAVFGKKLAQRASATEEGLSVVSVGTRLWLSFNFSAFPLLDGQTWLMRPFISTRFSSEQS